MKADLFLAISIVVASTIFAQELTPAGRSRVSVNDKPTKALSPEEVEKNHARAAAFRKAVADKGGWVTAPMAGPSMKLIDATAKGWAMSGLEAVKANLDRYGLCPSMVERKDVPIDALSDGFAAVKNASGVVMLVDGTETAPILAVYPEEHLAIINMTSLSRGVNGSGIRQDRVEKMTWRAIGHLVGCGAPDGYTCVMQPVKDMSALDAMPNKFIHPASFIKARSYFEMCGITPTRKASYESAVKQGWAPAPTNDVQRAIWERVRAEKERGPTNAIQIKP